jgi:hypothetical protein
MDIPELLLWMFVIGCAAVALAFGLWVLLPVAVLAWVLMPAADHVATANMEASEPGSQGALWAGIVTIVGAGVVVLLALLVAGGVL